MKLNKILLVILIIGSLLNLYCDNNIEKYYTVEQLKEIDYDYYPEHTIFTYYPQLREKYESKINNLIVGCWYPMGINIAKGEKRRGQVPS